MTVLPPTLHRARGLSYWCATLMRRAFSVVLGLALAAWLLLVLCAVVVQLWIVPRMDDYRPWVERQSSRALGVPVHIGSMHAESGGWRSAWTLSAPLLSLELADLHLLDAQGKVGLNLPSLRVAVSPQSLLGGGFQHIHIEAPAVAVQRTTQGTLRVAGFAIPLDDKPGTGRNGNALQRWVFAQPELTVFGGEVRWSDDLRGLPPVVFKQVNLSVRNSLRRHAVRLDALLPSTWGQRISLDARLRQPWLSRNTGNWRDWNGHIDTAAVDVSAVPLRAYAAEPILSGLGRLRIEQAQGSWRTAVELKDGEVVQATVDMDVAQATVRGASAVGARDPATTALLRELTGRVGFKRSSAELMLSTENLAFKLADGRRWPGGNVSLRLAHGLTGGSLQADRLDLAALAQFAAFLPLDASVKTTLASVAPQGVVNKLTGQWRGPLGAPTQFEFKGHVSKLALMPGEPYPVLAVDANASGNTATAPIYKAPWLSRPGITGATVDFTVTQAGGKARIDVQRGSVTVPGVFQDPVVALSSLGADLAWQGRGPTLAVQATALEFANEDTAGTLTVRWHSGEQASHRFPGVLDLDATLTGGAASRLPRYLPLALHPNVHEYVAATVQQGRLGEIKLKIKGDLFEFPFQNPKEGEFRIATRVHNAQFAYAALPDGWADPASLSAGSWPVLADLNGDLLIDGKGLQLRAATATLLGQPGLQITRGEAQIADFGNSVVTVNLAARGPAEAALAVVKASPVNRWTDHVLDPAAASGQTETSLRLSLPLKDLTHTQVAGTVSFAATQFSLKPDLPPLQRALGKLSFSESAFALQAVGDLLGGETRIEGGTPTALAQQPSAADAANTALVAPGVAPSVALPAPSVTFTAQGVASAQGLQAARDLGLVSHLADHATGQAVYSATVSVRLGVPEITVQSDLKGVALSLPPPFAKAADTAVALRVDNHIVRAEPLTDNLTVTLGGLGAASYVRDVSSPIARVVQGNIALGLEPGESVVMPRSGVTANVKLATVNLDAWDAVVTRLAGDMGAPTLTPTPMLTLPAPSASISAPTSPSPAEAYLPSTWAIRTQDLTVKGQHLKNLVVGGSRLDRTWRANLDADELSGYVEYLDSSNNSDNRGHGRLLARLTRLKLAAATATKVETALSEPPTHVPSLDIVVDDLELKSRRLGRLEVQAVNRSGTRREWLLNTFKLTLPEASLNASGRWTTTGVTGTSPVAIPTPLPARQTNLSFTLDMANAGDLLTRLGMNDVLKGGAGKLAGEVAWTGSPWSLDTPSLNGTLRIDMGKGQFLKADPGLAKLLGVLSLQSLPRRLLLDFSDAFADGFAFDTVRGDARIERGVASTHNLQMKGVSATVLMEGHADIGAETQNLDVVVIPEINAGTASLLASVVNPVVGLTTLVTQWILRRPLIEANTQSFHIDGPWAEPRVTRVVLTKALTKATPPVTQPSIPLTPLPTPEPAP